MKTFKEYLTLVESFKPNQRDLQAYFNSFHKTLNSQQQKNMEGRGNIEFEDQLKKGVIKTYDQVKDFVKKWKNKRQPKERLYTKRQIEKIVKDAARALVSDMGGEVLDDPSYLVDMLDSMLRDEKLLKSTIDIYNIPQRNYQQAFEKAKYILADLI